MIREEKRAIILSCNWELTELYDNIGLAPTTDKFNMGGLNGISLIVDYDKMAFTVCEHIIDSDGTYLRFIQFYDEKNIDINEWPKISSLLVRSSFLIKQSIEKTKNRLITMVENASDKQREKIVKICMGPR